MHSTEIRTLEECGPIYRPMGVMFLANRAVKGQDYKLVRTVDKINLMPLIIH